MPSTIVYVSNLWARDRSTRPIGFTISLHEYRAAQSVDRLFGDAPLRLPELVRGLIDSLWIHRVPKPVVQVSPPAPTKIPAQSNAIVIGAASRNSVRAAYVDNNLTFLQLDYEDQSKRTMDGHEGASGNVLIARGPRIGQVVESNGLHLAVVEKLYDPDSGEAVFFCAGVRGDTSWGAAEYLVRNWLKLHREFGSGAFALGLGFAIGDEYLEQYVDPRRVVSLPR